jgi:hypothetical protein
LPKRWRNMLNKNDSYESPRLKACRRQTLVLYQPHTCITMYYFLLEELLEKLERAQSLCAILTKAHLLLLSAGIAATNTLTLRRFLAMPSRSSTPVKQVFDGLAGGKSPTRRASSTSTYSSMSIPLSTGSQISDDSTMSRTSETNPRRFVYKGMTETVDRSNGAVTLHKEAAQQRAPPVVLTVKRRHLRKHRDPRAETHVRYGDNVYADRARGQYVLYNTRWV